VDKGSEDNARQRIVIPVYLLCYEVDIIKPDAVGKIITCFFQKMAIQTLG